MVLHCKSIPNQIHHHLIFTFPLPKQCTTINFSPLHLKYPNLQNNPQPPKTQTHNPFLCQIRALHHSNQLTASPSPNPCCPEITHLLTTTSPFNSHGEKPKQQPRQSMAALCQFQNLKPSNRTIPHHQKPAINFTINPIQEPVHKTNSPTICNSILNHLHHPSHHHQSSSPWLHQICRLERKRKKKLQNKKKRENRSAMPASNPAREYLITTTPSPPPRPPSSSAHPSPTCNYHHNPQSTRPKDPEEQKIEERKKKRKPELLIASCASLPR